MQVERRRDGERYVVEAYGPERQALDAQCRRFPGGYVQWEAQGILLRDADGRPQLSGPTFALWRPASPGAPLEGADRAEALAAVPSPDPAPPPSALQPPARRPRRPKSVRHKNITRVDRPERRLHGFHVRLAWKRRYYQRWFSDAAHGDRLGALAAALAWRDAKERELGKPRTERPLKGQDATSNTGIVGVARVSVRGRPAYRALWRDAEGRMHRRWFRVDRLGERRALRAAVRARERAVAALLR